MIQAWKQNACILYKQVHYFLHLQYHIVLLLKAARGTLTQDSMWYHRLQPEHSIHFVFGSSGILQMQYTGTFSTDLIVNSWPVSACCAEISTSLFGRNSSIDGAAFSPGHSGTDLGALQKPAQ